MTHQARDVVTRMRNIEDRVSMLTGEDEPALDRVVATLLDVEYEGLDVALEAETKRVIELVTTWYADHGVPVSGFAIAGVAFVQGITFAVAAARLQEGES